ncbi:MAG: molybdopterin biosynthesis protein [Acidobacteriota bacterium]
MQQSQFLHVLDRDEATRRFHQALDLSPLESETIPLGAALGRVLAGDIRADRDVPGFTRSNMDGFAIIAADSFGCREEAPGTLSLNAEVLAPGVRPGTTVRPGTATAIATGGVLPRGADAVIRVEDTQAGPSRREILVYRPVPPGSHLSQAGSDIARGETVLRRGALLTSRETGVLAALGRATLDVVRRPRVSLFSTGNELVAPGGVTQVGSLFDANATLLADAIREAGGEPLPLGILPDDEAKVEAALRESLRTADMVLLSGGTSKGAGDINARVVGRLTDPGILAHGVALKPGKPVCLAAHGTRPVVILPGFPTSAIFTFHEFVAPVLRALAGRPPSRPGRRPATLPVRLNSESGRTEYTLVALVEADPGDRQPPGSRGALPMAVPLGRGSGSVTAFGAADGFVTIPRQTEYLDSGEVVEVTLLSRALEPVDLLIQGSHCLGLDLLLDGFRREGFTARFLAVGSAAGLRAAAAGHADLAGIHLLDPGTGAYNRPFLPRGVTLLEGYGRMQGIVFRRDDPRFRAQEARQAMEEALAAGAGCVFINRNRGSGTRVLIEELLGNRQPPGFSIEARSHHAVAAAVAQGRADWGVAIENVARLNDLGFLSLREERFDFAVAPHRNQRPPVQAFARLLADPAMRCRLQQAGFR